jgi:hypothetical protein
MKKMFMLLPVIAICCSCSKSVKEKDVPASAKTKLSSLYPEAKNAKWTKEKDGFEADFELGTARISVLIDANGNLEQAETEIAVSSLPQAVPDYVSKNFSGKTIKEASRIVDAAGTVTYEAEVGGEDYLFDVNGNFIKKETDDPDDDEDND